MRICEIADDDAQARGVAPGWYVMADDGSIETGPYTSYDHAARAIDDDDPEAVPPLGADI